MNSHQKRALKTQQIKTMSDEERTEIHKILNEFISKNRTKHFRILNRRLRGFLGDVDTDTVEDTLQNIYVYMYLNPEKVKDFYSTGYLDRLFNSIVYHVFTLMNVSQSMPKDLPLLEEMDFEYEEENHYSTESLDPTLSNETRLEGHRIALDELYSYLFDNPQSNLKKALDLTKNTYPELTYRVAINYCATPSYTFLYKNREKLGLKNIQPNLQHFKEICAQVYGKKLVWNAQSSWRKF